MGSLMGKQLLLISSGVWHPTLLARSALNAGLRSAFGRYQRIAHLDAIPRVDLAHIDVIVLYFHHKTVSDDALKQLNDFVKGGGGLVAWHSASASFKGNEQYSTLLGGHFVDHGPITTLTVSPVEGVPAPFEDLGPFTVRDELYRHAFSPDNQIVLYTQVEGSQEPISWLRNVEKGRVFYCALGHTASALRQPPVKRLIQQSIEWASGVSVHA